MFIIEVKNIFEQCDKYGSVGEASDHLKWDQSLEEGSIPAECNFGKKQNQVTNFKNASAKKPRQKKKLRKKEINEKNALGSKKIKIYYNVSDAHAMLVHRKHRLMKLMK